MKEKHSEENESKGIFYEELEQYARGKIREHLEDLLEQEVTEWLGRDRKACSYVSTVRPSTTNLRFEAMPWSIKDEFVLRLPTLVKAINKAAFIQSRAETHINDIVGL